jgi:predicted dehydrogenase
MTELKVAVLGCGGMCGNHVLQLAKMENVHVVALCDINHGITKTFAEKNLTDYQKKVSHYTDYHRMFKESDVNTAVIASPHTLHFDHACAALNAGLDVFLEKPMVTSVDQAYALKEKVEETGKLLVVGYNTPCTLNFQYLRRVIRNKGLGRLELVNGFISQNWISYTEGAWRRDPKLSGGGQAYDSGAHILNSLIWSVESGIDQVFSYADFQNLEVDVNTATSVRFKNGVLACIVIGGNCASDGGHMSFLFEGGRIDIDGWEGKWMHVFQGSEEILPNHTGENISPIHSFVRVICEKGEAAANVEHGVMQSELLDAIYASAARNRPINPKDLRNT